MESARVDRWLWSVRLYKTRTEATSACRGGHVRINGATARPSAPVRAGDRVETRGPGRDRIVEVVRVVDKRVGAPVAAECLIDRSPPRDPRPAPPFARERGAGRPTKKERRQLDRLRHR